MLWIMRGVKSCRISVRIDVDCDNCMLLNYLPTKYPHWARNLLPQHYITITPSSQEEIRGLAHVFCWRWTTATPHGPYPPIKRFRFFGRATIIRALTGRKAAA